MSSKIKTPSVAIASEEENKTLRSKRVKRKTEFYAKSSVHFKGNGVLKSLGIKPAPTGAQKGAPFDWSGGGTFLCPGRGTFLCIGRGTFLCPGASFYAPVGAPFCASVGSPY